MRPPYLQYKHDLDNGDFAGTYIEWLESEVQEITRKKDEAFAQLGKVNEAFSKRIRESRWMNAKIEPPTEERFYLVKYPKASYAMVVAFSKTHGFNGTLLTDDEKATWWREIPSAPDSMEGKHD